MSYWSNLSEYSNFSAILCFNFWKCLFEGCALRQNLHSKVIRVDRPMFKTRNSIFYRFALYFITHLLVFTSTCTCLHVRGATKFKNIFTTKSPFCIEGFFNRQRSIHDICMQAIGYVLNDRNQLFNSSTKTKLFQSQEISPIFGFIGGKHFFNDLLTSVHIYSYSTELEYHKASNNFFLTKYQNKNCFEKSIRPILLAKNIFLACQPEDTRHRKTKRNKADKKLLENFLKGKDLHLPCDLRKLVDTKKDKIESKNPNPSDILQKIQKNSTKCKRKFMDENKLKNKIEMKNSVDKNIGKENSDLSVLCFRKDNTYVTNESDIKPNECGNIYEKNNPGGSLNAINAYNHMNKLYINRPISYILQNKSLSNRFFSVNSPKIYTRLYSISYPIINSEGLNNSFHKAKMDLNEKNVSQTSSRMLVDIGANLCDNMFKGIYHGTQKHKPDLSQVLTRAKAWGVRSIILTSGCLDDFIQNLKICKEYDPEGEFLYTTIGVHPTRCNEFECEEKCEEAFNACASDYYSCAKDVDNKHDIKEKIISEFTYKLTHTEPQELTGMNKNCLKYMAAIYYLCKKNISRVKALGELGLDYDRTHFCPENTQKMYFSLQLRLCSLLKLPLFLHMRNASDDFFEIMDSNKAWDACGGVVHSFTGTLKEAQMVLNRGLYIGLNGCSLKTEENLEAVKQLPLDKVLLETDAPWCDMRPTHTSLSILTEEEKQDAIAGRVKAEKWMPSAMVKSRNEPCMMRVVARVVGRLIAPEIPHDEFIERIYQNTKTLFPDIP